jgi:acetyltransferase-like isoleucine patch superfamily enzyme
MKAAVIAPSEVMLLGDVHDSAKLGLGTVAWRFSSVLAGVVTGVNCSIGTCAEVGQYSVLGDNVRIGHGAFLPSRSTIGDRVFIGPNATFTDDRRPRVNNVLYHAAPPVVERDASIGAGAVILPGIRIGEGALVGAGAVVTKDVAPFTTVCGNPARVMPKKGD